MTSSAATEVERVAPRRRWVSSQLKRLWPLAIPLVIGSLLLRQRFLVPVPVNAVKVDRGTVTADIFGRGTLESLREVDLGFDVIGRIQELSVDEGDVVQKGAVLARLEPTQLLAEQVAAQSGVAVARAAVARLDAEERKAGAALAFAEVDAKRIRTLQANGTVAARELDQATQQLEQATAELERVRAGRAEALRQIAAAGSNVEVRSAAAARGQLVAPFDGQVVRRLRDPGDTVSVGAAVLRVVARDSLRSRAWIDDSALSRLDVGQPVSVRFGATGVATSKGAVDRIGHEADRQTHEVWVDVRVLDLPPRVALGQRADVWIEVARAEDVLRIPSRFLKWEGATPYCYVARNGKIERAGVQLGRRGSDFVEVKSGLREGESVLDSLESGKALPQGRKFSSVP